ncbi:MAG: FAD:protein FMN transferase [Pseudoclavibacter sp.]
MAAPFGVARWRDWSVDVRVVTVDARAIAAAERICRDEMAAVAAAIDRFDPESELSRLTGRVGRAEEVTAEVSPMLAACVRAALDAAAETDGLVDPTVGSDLRRAGYTVDVDEIDADAPYPEARPQRRSWRDIRLTGSGDGNTSGSAATLRLPADVVLDFGATAKALAADRAARRAATQLGTGVLASLGGDVSAAGPEPVGGWRIRLQDGPAEPAWTVTLRGAGGIATSSLLHRVWMRAGRQAGHIIDPRTGQPVPPVWRTVAVIAPTCLAANVWSTAAMVLGRDAPARLKARHPALLVPEAGEPLEVGGWPRLARRTA